MDFEKVKGELSILQEQIESNKIDTEFERNMLYNYLGERLIKILKKYNCYIAGGLITSLFTNREINDVDVYFRKKDDMLGFIEDLWGDRTYVVSHTDKATLFNYYGELDVQVIHFDYFETPGDIFNTFDFTAVMGAFDFATEEFVFHRDFLKHNSQRILKFNKNTAFPLISLLRVKKYEEKGYTISKSELMRIALTCMNLNINSYEELKDQLGGMYGESYDRMFEELSDEEFSLEKAIDYLQNLCLRDDYFENPVSVDFDNLEELLETINGGEFRYFIHNGSIYRIGYNGKIKRYYRKLPENAIKEDGEKYFNSIKLYKFVEKTNDGRYVSYYDRNFEYKINEFVRAKNDDYGLFFNLLDEIGNSTYTNRDSKVLIEVNVKFDEFIEYSGEYFRFRECFVTREVPKEEWDHLIE